MEKIEINEEEKMVVRKVLNSDIFEKKWNSNTIL